MIYVLTDNNELKYSYVEFIKKQKINYKDWYCPIIKHVYHASHNGKLNSGICGEMISPTQLQPWWEIKNINFNEGNYTCNFLRKSCFCGTDINVVKAKDKETYDKFVELILSDKVNNCQLADENDNIIALGRPQSLDTFELHINYGKKCNFDCSYCSTAIHDNFSSFLSLDKIEYLFKLLDNPIMNNKKLTITGGEPVISKEIFKLVELAQQYDYNSITINSNGSASLNRYLRLLNSGVKLYISFHEEFSTDKHIENICKLQSSHPSQLSIKLLGNKDAENNFYKRVKHIFGEKFDQLPFFPIYVNRFTKIVNNIEEVKEYYKNYPDQRNL